MSSLRAEALRRILATSLRVLAVIARYALLLRVVAQFGTPLSNFVFGTLLAPMLTLKLPPTAFSARGPGERALEH